ncbi:MAG: alcohol dehydrogenase catalytic domain-containing protein [Anaerolineae bacterium]
MDMMRALQIKAPGLAEIVDLPVPEPGPGQVVVRVQQVNTCPHWDLHIYRGKPMFVGSGPVPYPYAPGQPGHEAAGEIHAVGEGVPGLSVGDRVAMWRDQGQDRPGCYAQYVVAESANVLKVPDGVALEKVVSLELSMCVAASILELKAWGGIQGQRVGVSGLGPAGRVAAQMLKAEGAYAVIGSELNAERRRLAVGAGDVDDVFDPLGPAEQLPPRRRQPGAFETSIDCVGLAASVHFMMDHTDETLALFGVQREDYVYGVRHAGLRLFGYPGHHVRAAQYAMDLIADGKLDLRPLASARLPLDQYAEGVRMLEAGEALKICYLPWE